MAKEREVLFLVGGGTMEEYVAFLEQQKAEEVTPEADDEVEFVSPRVPGRMQRRPADEGEGE